MYKFIFLLIFGILIFLTYKSEYFFYPIDEIVIISKEKNYNQKKINNYIDSLYGKNLLTIDIDEIQKNITSDSWIRDAEIAKLFPSKLTINIIQHIPIAIYNSKLITSNGILIKPLASHDNLPKIDDYSNNIQSANHILSTSLKNLNRINLEVNKIIIYHSLIKIYASNILLITDKEKFEKNLKRLIGSFNKIKEIYDKEIISIDMRYSNGFAIK